MEFATAQEEPSSYWWSVCIRTSISRTWSLFEDNSFYVERSEEVCQLVPGRASRGSLRPKAEWPIARILLKERRPWEPVSLRGLVGSNPTPGANLLYSPSVNWKDLSKDGLGLISTSICPELPILGLISSWFSSMLPNLLGNFGPSADPCLKEGACALPCWPSSFPR